MARSKVLLNVLNMVDASVQELPVEKQFLNDLKMSIERNDSKGQRKPTQSYKPSSMHCIRNMAYQVTGVEPETSSASSELVGICESGTDRHIRIQDAVAAMKNNNIDCEYCDVGEYVKKHGLTDRLEILSKSGNETKLYHKTLNMRFLCDGIIRYKGKYYILEIKTETSNKFWDQNSVRPEHVLQGTAYAVAFDIDDVIFLYECRDNCSKKVFMLHVTDQMKQDLVGKITECDYYVKNQLVPPKPTLDKMTCAYCAYANRCKKDG